MNCVCTSSANVEITGAITVDHGGRLRLDRGPGVRHQGGPLGGGSVRHQGAHDLLVGQGPELHTHAAARNGDELGRHKLSQRDEHRVGRRFFDRFQKRGNGIARKVEVGEHDDLAPSFERAPNGYAAHLAGLVYGQGGALAFKKCNVGMRSLPHTPAGVTTVLAAVGTEQHGGKLPCSG